MKEVEECNSIKDVKKRGETLLKAKAAFNLWMDIQKAHDKVTDKL